MKKKNFLFVSVLCLLGILLVGCDGLLPTLDMDYDIASTWNESHSRWLDRNLLSNREQLALLHGSDNQRKSSAEMLASVHDFMEARQVSHLRINTRATEVITKDFEHGFITSRGEPSASSVGLYLFILESTVDPERDPGFILAVDDIRIGHILAFVPMGNFNDPESDFMNMFRYNIESHIRKTIDTYNSITLEDIKAAQERVEPNNLNAGRAVFNDVYDWVPPITTSMLRWPPHFDPIHSHTFEGLLRTTWGQSGHYGIATASINGYSGLNLFTYRVGHDVIALAQIVAHHRRTRQQRPSVNAPFSSIRSFSGRGSIQTDQVVFISWNNAFIFFGDLIYDWGGMKSAPLASNPSVTQANRDQITTLIFQVGCKMDKVFSSSGGSNTPIEQVWNALHIMGYSSFGIQSGTANNNPFSGYFGMRRSLDSGRPVYVNNPGNCCFNATSWVIDNFKVSVSQDPFRLFVSYHCIVGDGSLFDGWYDAMILHSARFITGIHWPE